MMAQDTFNVYANYSEPAVILSCCFLLICALEES